MPRHSIAAKWNGLALELEWDVSKFDSISLLQRYALIVMMTYPNEKIRKSFLEFYFNETAEKPSPSVYNHHMVVRDYIVGNRKYQKSFNINVEDILNDYANYSLLELKDMVRGDATIRCS